MILNPLKKQSMNLKLKNTNNRETIIDKYNFVKQLENRVRPILVLKDFHEEKYFGGVLV